MRRRTYVVYRDRSFATVSEGKCDCKNHQNPCPFIRMIPSGEDEDNVFETVT